MKIIMQGNWLPFAAIIRVATFSRWHHCGVIIGDKVLESRMFGGVQLTPINEFKNKGTWQVINVPLPDEKIAEKWGMSQLGKSYDFGSLIRLAFHRNWTKDEKWYCSELVAEYSKQGGLPLFSDRAKGVLPEDLNKLPYEVTEHAQLE